MTAKVKHKSPFPVLLAHNCLKKQVMRAGIFFYGGFKGTSINQEFFVQVRLRGGVGVGVRPQGLHTYINDVYIINGIRWLNCADEPSDSFNKVSRIWSLTLIRDIGK